MILLDFYEYINFDYFTNLHMANLPAELLIIITSIIIALVVNKLFPNKNNNKDSSDYYDYDYDDNSILDIFDFFDSDDDDDDDGFDFDDD